jgi:Flp pilus assembly protein TadG
MSLLRSNRHRQGAAVVELAVTLPVIAILTFGAIEATSLISFRQRLLTAAYEAARTACGPAETSTTGAAAGTSVLTARGINGGSVTISPTVTTATPTGTEITATATAPFASNTWMKPFILNGIDNVAVTVTMTRQ